MNEGRFSADADCLSPDARRRIADEQARFNHAIRAGLNPRIEDYIPADWPDDERRELLLDLLEIEFHYRQLAGEPLRVDEYLRRFPDQADAVRSAFPGQPTNFDGGAPPLTPPTAETASPGGTLAFLGRYRIEVKLGGGTFGVVYRGRDDTLGRAVAIKMPRPELVEALGGVDNYIQEARVLAGLEHPHIVPVHDVGHTDDGLCYVVYGFVEGSDLKGCLAQRRFTLAEAARLAAAIAEALQHAHQKGIYHRDVKPANILVDARGKAYLADFGLALRHQDYGQGPTFAGTPAYMSPEQARRESHRVDGRADIFSLGAVFFELLTGQRAFQGTADQVRDRIARGDVRPPRQLDSGIPSELQRICLRALARLVSDRYTTAADMADDLRAWLAAAAPDNRPAVPADALSPADAASASSISANSVSTEPAPVRVVPKGLRSFDAGDADFFLELLPGPRDRTGLPDCLRFWKARVEPTDPERAFAVGLMYGPSGCGKSSLVKAGLLPRLAGHVVAVYVEATPDDSEARLRRGLHKHCPGLSEGLGLVESIATLRNGRGLAPGQKVLLVLDQFEQWLHARGSRPDEELVQALWQCDGGRVQALVMVRDDFWMAVTRFLRELEVRLVEGQNSAAVDLFDADHAGKVLATFGRAFGKLPQDVAALTKEQQAFLSQAVAALAQDSKVGCVRLALFAEMMKGRPWTPSALREVGGVEGVGATFLEETFSAPGAPPEHRYHQKAARQVLKALLPEAGSDIKGAMRSRQALQEAAGHGARPKEFAQLLQILDGEVRLITPTDPEGQAEAADAPRQVAAGERYYQLTHDYLVPSLREWLTRKQKETRRGRAELRLAERAVLWNSKPETRHLPAWWEWLNIRLFTRNRDWTSAQRRMMRRAGPYHAFRGTLLALGLALITFGGWWTHGALRARSLVDTLLTAKTADVPEVVHDLGQYRRWADPRLRDEASRADLDDRKRLHVALALLPVDTAQADYLGDRLLAASSAPEEVKVIRKLLHDHAAGSAAGFWPVLQGEAEDRPRRLRAACALALANGDDPRWDAIGDEVVRCLAGENLLLLRDWAALLKPVRGHLIRHQVRRLVEADAGGFAAFLAMLRVYPEDAPAVLHAQLERSLPATAKQEDREALARQQAQAAVALLHLGRSERTWPLFRQGEDPTCRTYLIHRCAALGVDPAILAGRLLGGEEKDASIRQGLLLALGEYSADQRAEVRRGPLVERVVSAYRDDSDPGVHSASEWLLRRWKMSDRLAPIQAGTGWAPAVISKPRWYVNGQGQTFAVVPAPGQFEIGSPPDERQRLPVEERRPVQIDYPFAVAVKLVTVAEFKKFQPDFKYAKQYSPGKDTPINGVRWYDAVAYCNWLSEQEKIPKEQWCYERNAKGAYAEGMKLKTNYGELSGYRLPRAAEWEYACRAGTVTAWSHGSDESLLGQYAWYNVNSNSTMHPVGALKPNGLGLFDAHGNSCQWCQEAAAIGDDDIKDTYRRYSCGGSFGGYAWQSRSASRIASFPADRDVDDGFRVARTYH
jgi:serine/threonine protein kinase/formylglycine-generating enzyme required for sulfatase activity